MDLKWRGTAVKPPSVIFFCLKAGDKAFQRGQQVNLFFFAGQTTNSKSVFSSLTSIHKPPNPATF